MIALTLFKVFELPNEYEAPQLQLCIEHLWCSGSDCQVPHSKSARVYTDQDTQLVLHFVELQTALSSCVAVARLAAGLNFGICDCRMKIKQTVTHVEHTLHLRSTQRQSLL